MKEGYAYVKFRRDNLKKVVPASFIRSDDFDIKSFSLNRQYWVFMSNDPEDTPDRSTSKGTAAPYLKLKTIQPL